ncbi:Hint domain-containing protein [Leisingera aquimarina]|uniref:Hint domain-containing protein n=1 Tax=Leisingera aquimarina TaxID=476529 RepID=UPI000482E01C|nr:Hint domain-containing protein [Leisingera aquimarina]
MLDWLLKRTQSPAGRALNSGFPLVPAGQGGLLAGTHVASNLGWRPVEALTPGDKVLTFDHGMQTVVELQRETIVPGDGGLDPARCPLLVPRDALMNRVPLWLMPDQGVLLESDLVEDVQGDPFAVVPTAALEGYRGIRRMHPGAQLELVMPRFAQDQVIYLEAGMLGFAAAPVNLMCGRIFTEESAYRVLPPDEARGLVLSMMAEEERWRAPGPASAAARYHPPVN